MKQKEREKQTKRINCVFWIILIVWMIFSSTMLWFLWEEMTETQRDLTEVKKHASAAVTMYELNAQAGLIMVEEIRAIKNSVDPNSACLYLPEIDPNVDVYYDEGAVQRKVELLERIW